MNDQAHKLDTCHAATLTPHTPKKCLSENFLSAASPVALPKSFDKQDLVRPSRDHDGRPATPKTAKGEGGRFCNGYEQQLYRF